MLGSDISEVDGKKMPDGTVVVLEEADSVEKVYVPDKDGKIIRIIARAPFPSVDDALEAFTKVVKKCKDDPDMKFQKYGSSATSYVYHNATTKMFFRIEIRTINKVPYLQSKVIPSD